MIASSEHVRFGRSSCGPTLLFALMLVIKSIIKSGIMYLYHHNIGLQIGHNITVFSQAPHFVMGNRAFTFQVLQERSHVIAASMPPWYTQCHKCRQQ